MNAEFFLLAFTAALNPKLLAVDLLLVENRRPRAMFVCLLLGGMSIAVAIGLADVLAAHPGVTKSQSSASAGLDLAIGLVLLAVGGLIATGRLHGRKPAAASAPDGKPAKKKDGNSWAQRVLGEPRLGLAVAVGVLIGLPGAVYLDAMHNLAAGHWSTATQVVAVIVFVIIEFLLLIVPFAFLEFRPEATKARLRKAQDWLQTHAKHLVVAIALVLGGYLAIEGLVRLLLVSADGPSGPRLRRGALRRGV